MIIKYQDRSINVPQEDAAKFNWISRDLFGKITLHVEKPEELLTDGGLSTGTFDSQKEDKVLEKGCDNVTLYSWRNSVIELKSVLLPEGAFDTWCPESTIGEGESGIIVEDTDVRVGVFKVSLIMDYRDHSFWFDFQDLGGNFTGFKFKDEESATCYIFKVRVK